MTDSNDNSSTRPISVAELLARNGSIGAPPVGGRRRRRRGNSDAVTVAELTGEIPIITDDSPSTGQVPVHTRPEPVVEVPTHEPVEEPVAQSVEEPIDELVVDPEEPVADEPEPAAEPEPEPEPELTEAEADYAAHLEQRNADPSPLEFAPRSRRSQAVKPSSIATQESGAEQMSPDPAVDEDEMLDFGADVDFNEVLDKHSSAVDDAEIEANGVGADGFAPDGVVADGVATEDELPSYLRSNADTLFGGQSVADDLARRGTQSGPGDVVLGGGPIDAETEQFAGTRKPAEQSGSALVRGAWVVAQCVLAVAFGAGLFIAFDQLWRWNTIVALVLSVLVILGLVVGVRVVRKTEDIGSTLIAVAVGALVTLGPLALLQSH